MARRGNIGPQRPAPFSVDGDGGAAEGLGDEVADDAAVIGVHPRPEGVEDPVEGGGEKKDRNMPDAVIALIPPPLIYESFPERAKFFRHLGGNNHKLAPPPPANR